MNSVSGWFAIPLSLAILGVTLVVMSCLKRKHIKLSIKGLGVEININTVERGHVNGKSVGVTSDHDDSSSRTGEKQEMVGCSYRRDNGGFNYAL